MASMRYISTRGQSEPRGFCDAVMTGLAPDGGLLIPESIPDLSADIPRWGALAYEELAFEIIRRFADLPEEDLRGLMGRSCGAFRHPEITPSVKVGPVHILELFHGPTLAFKDIALQFLSRLFEHILRERETCLNILGATSGDTGSAAIHGVRGRERIQVFMMHPRGRVAPLQERQMTTVLDGNVFNLAVDGTFDDCQRLMKETFGDLPFKDRHHLGAVNSVNWARVLTQVVYYVYAALRVREETGASRVRFAVPTGNFGDILAGWYAIRLGAPISRLVLATNENDILARFFATGAYRAGRVVKTISPSMDIQVASNFERYLYYRLGGDPERLRRHMAGFARDGALTVPVREGEPVDPEIVAGAGDTETTLAAIRSYHQRYGVVLDPHTAVGVRVCERWLDDEEPMICLATAHPAKFGDAIRRAIGEPAHHEVLDGLLEAPSRCESIPNDPEALRAYIADHALPG